MTETVLAALIGGGATLTAAVVGALTIVGQIARQGQLNRESVAENERRRLKSKLYEEVEAACNAYGDAQASFLSKLLLASQEIQIAAYSERDGYRYAVPQGRIMELSRLSGDLHTAAIDLVMLIERRQFIDPKLIVFRTALNAALHPVRKAFQDEFFGPAMRMLPTDRPDGEGIFPYTPPSPEDADQLNDIALRIAKHLSTAVGYVEDFAIEMQNLLVADLFGTNVVHRIPMDPAERVIRLDQAEALERYFIQETEWGRWVAQEEAKALARLASQRDTK